MSWSTNAGPSTAHPAPPSMSMFWQAGPCGHQWPASPQARGAGLKFSLKRHPFALKICWSGPGVRAGKVLLDRDQPQAQLVIRRLVQFNTFFRRPDHRLLMQRNMRNIVALYRHRLGDQLVAFGGIELAGD